MSASIEMSTRQVRTRCDNLRLEMNKVRVVPRFRLVIEIVSTILGATCFALAAALATGLLIVGCSIWLMPTCFALGSALLTLAITSALFRQGELKLERSWRSHAMRWNYFASDLQRALEFAKHKRNRELTSSSSESVYSC